MDPCPEDSGLLAFHRGDSPLDELDRIARHLEVCAPCSAKLALLDGQPEPVIDALRMHPDARAATRDQPEPGPTIPGYEIVGRLGAGGMSVVHKARHIRLGRLVALKRLKADSSCDLDRFRREAEAVAALQHPNVVQIFEIGDHAGQPYLALEYVAGGSLSEFLGRRPQPAREAAALVATLARAVEHAHRQGIVHRDLKPANILLRRSSEAEDHRTAHCGDLPLSAFTPKVGDFGIAKRIVDAESGLGAGDTRPGSILGTPSYMAPEQAMGRTVGPPADVYALGAILYELLTGRPPFSAVETYETLRQVVHDDPLPPSRTRPGLPRDVETICLKCLHKEPSKRYGSAAELAADLERFLEGRPVLARPAPAWDVAWKWARRRPATAAAIAVAQASLVVLAVGVSWYSRRLQDALVETRAAGHQAEQNARLALDAHKQLVEQVQTMLRDAPETRALRKGLLETAVSGLQRVTGADSSAPRVSRAMAHQLLGEVLWELGHTRQAIEQMQLCRQLARDLLVAEPGLADARDLLTTVTRRLGSLHLHDDRPIEARRYMNESLASALDWRKADPRDPRTRPAVIEGYVNLGHAAHWAHDFREARPALIRAGDQSEAWLAAEPENDDANRLLGETLDLLAAIDQAEGNHPGALASFRRSLELAVADEKRAAARARSAAPGARVAVERTFRGVMVAQDNLANALVRVREFAAARVQMDAALDRARRAVRNDPEDIQRQLDLVDALYDRASIEQADARHGDAISILSECRSLLERLESEGRLSGRPMYAIERREAVDRELQMCRLLPGALDDDEVVWSAPELVAFALARTKVDLLLAAGRAHDSIATARRLAAREPGDFVGWFGLARACSQTAGLLKSNQATATDPELATRLLDRAAFALGRAVDLSKISPTADELKGDERLSALHGHPAFAALLARVARKP